MTPFYNRDSITIYNTDCIEAMRQLPDNSISSCLTDPPYGLTDELDITELLTHWLAGDEYEHGKAGFMGEKWDVVPGPPVWREVFRVMKPGGCLMAFGGTRTVDLLSIAIRLAGFQKFDEISWVYASGFPKSTDISNQIDRTATVPCPACSDEPLESPSEQSARLRRAMQKENNEGSGCLICNGTGKVKGAEREVVGKQKLRGTARRMKGGNYNNFDGPDTADIVDITAPATPAAVEWDGYGTALAPACEKILCFWRPRVGTYAANALEWGVAGLNVERGRIGTDTVGWKGKPSNGYGGGFNKKEGPRPVAGRWPKNFIHDGSRPIMAEFEKAGVSVSSGRKGKRINPWTAKGRAGIGVEVERTIASDSGSAARFYFTAKADAKQRPFYCHECQAVFEAQTRPRHKHGRPDWEHVTSHPTQKPESLMSYLVGLLAPPKDAVILDPFMGSGTTLLSALLLGVKAIGIDLEREFCEIARHRLRQPTIWAVEEPAGEAKSKPTQSEMELEC